MADKIKRFVECHIPVTACTLRCHYCYVTQQRKFDAKWTYLKYTPKFIAHSALSRHRLGGVCMMNICGAGETLIPTESIELTREFLKEGHYVTLVTNGTLPRRFDELASLDGKLLERLFIKFSYQFLELKRLHKLDVFFENILKIKRAGASFALEITPNDRLVPYIGEVMEYSLKYLKALPHVTIARSDDKPGTPMLTTFSKDEFAKIWSVFESEMFNFKLPVFGQKRTEFCYAGDWSFCVNLGTGQTSKCYAEDSLGNIFVNPELPINFSAVGCNCKLPHCYNAHSFLLWGNIPGFTKTTYADIRDRICSDNSHWLNDKMREFMSSKLSDSNQEYSEEKKSSIEKRESEDDEKNKGIIKKLLGIWR